MAIATDQGQRMTNGQILLELVNVRKRFAAYRRMAALPHGYLLTDWARRGEMTLLALSVTTWLAIAVACGLLLAMPVFGERLGGIAGVVLGGQILVWSWGLEEIVKGNVDDKGPFGIVLGDIEDDTVKGIRQLQLIAFAAGVGLMGAAVHSLGFFTWFFAK